jgi:hypothetical protein
MRRRALTVLAALAVLLTALLPGSAAARDTGDAVVVTGRVDVQPGERAGTIVVADGNIDVRRGGQAEDVVAAAGDVRVAGRITGDLVTFGGRAFVLSSGVVDGDIRYGDKKPVIEPGATVGGDVEKIDTDLGGAAPFIGALVFWLAVSVSMLVLGLLLLWIAPRAADAARAQMRGGGWGPAAGVGLVLLIGLPLLALLAFVTLLGIPLAIALLLALLPLAVLGYVTSAWLLGSALVDSPPRRRWVAFLAGWAILRVVALIPFFGAIAFLIAAMFGLGALGRALWAARGTGGPAAPAAAGGPESPAAPAI